ncbi:MAG: hypothetical protein CO144_02220 [Candidatus Nealsonbacteria bacterium CG_4_9_14_3_um_filter_35_11]|uniref:Heat-inducible transcription repressor HrcA C-terminal domain-containing protein n=2 Tax=Candidatus Nealsoniibacteriota TaxID=1817911 RepID=A0A2M7DB77_9BACT|nr:MAG: hypothetical protein COV62_01950 [Candidatus Nealsonbacteria bacterium CG11_big_fil_rev_8_21_14_0_20_35_11]PIV45711.1 MAG: hypothetical protein COS24_00775 [Candidatus Nealsonbacteria bacterium CG02_land_8_20_14_3_00_34_20]PIW92792.1 MAG: hypothetical protein COZ88_00320 [Candidatus Nealsonbacteria bacterium CG_4_8_14_3_um_filter_34_13]PJA84318.1 MAG: hypothetical protein CO144_02220 [Candidatus Nealsonbacteria bacterium CG_4_9_14_3_um_filter_35_11]
MTIIKLMNATYRQTKILNTLIEDYIKLAKPISSQLLLKRHNFGLSPATIRNELQELTSIGYLNQPHISSGRVPTDKGYRFFVNDFLESNFKDYDKEFFKDFKKMYHFLSGNDNILKFTHEIAQSLARTSESFSVVYLKEAEFFWKEGWQEVFQEPEFKNSELIFRFVKMMDNFEKEIESISLGNLLLKVYIGRESPFARSQDFSIIVSKCHFPNDIQGFLCILGPKRMAYKKNINLLNSLAKTLESL